MYTPQKIPNRTFGLRDGHECNVSLTHPGDVPDERERDDDDDVEAEGDDARRDQHRHHVLVPELRVDRGYPGVFTSVWNPNMHLN